MQSICTVLPHIRTRLNRRYALCHLQFFDDSNITDIFDQLISYQILLDLLYDRKMYGDVLRINDEIQRRIAAQNRYASSAMNAIIFATYYRLVRAQYIKHTYITSYRIFCTYITCTNIPPSLSPCHNMILMQNYANLFKHIFNNIITIIQTEYTDSWWTCLWHVQSAEIVWQPYQTI